MGWNEALQGLLGGVNQGLGGFLDNRNQQMEQQNRERLTRVQEAEALRAQQGQEWTQANEQYKQLVGEVDAATAQPLVNKGFSFLKGPGGGLMRPLSVQEQYQSAQVDPAFIQKEAELKFAPQGANAALERAARSETDLAQMENALKLANIQGATSRYTADKGYDSRLAANEAVTARLQTAADIKAGAAPTYLAWKKDHLDSAPTNMLDYNKAVREFGAVAAEEAMQELYNQLFKKP